MSRLFGTDGVRGVANAEPMTAETVLRIGKAAAQVCAPGSPGRRFILIGRDPRRSGPLFEYALAAGCCSVGVDVALAGVLPTPAVAFLTRSLRADAGVMISASHNPYQDNGIKIFRRDGAKLSDAEEDAIQALVEGDPGNDPAASGNGIGETRPLTDAHGRYLQFCRQAFPGGRTLDGLRLVLDCANGAVSHLAPALFSELGADVTVIHGAPDGVNINHHCGATNPCDLARTVRETGADAGLAFDGDGDRLVAVDEQGTALSGDHLLAICARRLEEAGRLPGHRIVATVMSNFGFRLAMKDRGIDVVECPVGDRAVAAAMRDTGAALGGESSGHIIFRDLHTSGDGLISALQLLSVMRDTGQSLSALASIVTLAPQHLINVAVARRPPLDSVPEIRDAVAEAESSLAGAGRVLIRYSGTEGLCRVMVEARDEGVTRHWAEALAQTVRASLG